MPHSGPRDFFQDPKSPEIQGFLSKNSNKNSGEKSRSLEIFPPPQISKSYLPPCPEIQFVFAVRVLRGSPCPLCHNFRLAVTANLGHACVARSVYE